MKTPAATRRAVIAALVLFLPAGSVLAQGAVAPAGGEPGAARVKAMAEHARSIQVTAPGDRDPAARVPLIPAPVLRYDDKPRNIFDATLWAWGTKGRPAAILKIENYPSRPESTRWIYGIVSVSTGLITVEGDEGWRWSSGGPGLVLKAIPGAPAPAGTESLRLTQMRQLARRFEAHEDEGPPRGRLQLRLMPRPVHRYSDPDSGLLDGAIFAFAYGTNPDLLLALESSRQGGQSPVWRYGLARLGGGATFVGLDGHEVWTETAVNIPVQRQTYMNRWQRNRAGP